MTVTVSEYDDFRDAARRLIAGEVAPEQVLWLPPGDGALPFDGTGLADAGATVRTPRVPRSFVALAEQAACHRSQAQWPALYRLLWRIVHEGAQILEQDTDPDVRTVNRLASQVRRDEHQMRAFLRFIPLADPSGSRYVAWYEPDHLIVRRAAPFFADRFSGMKWSILTPDLCAHWDGATVTFLPGAVRPTSRADDEAVSSLWRTYYESMFNPARVNPRAMQRDMPARRWRRLPEATLIPRLIDTATAQRHRVASTRSADSARPFVPAGEDFATLREASTRCQGCRLHERATQTVFGDGPSDARLVLIGEQPGDEEDEQGRPFVGPAGRVLDAALAAADIARDGIYVTNAVKHFSFEPRGKRRIHQTPRLSEMLACRPWLEAELRSIRPATVVAMGATAARALLGPQARVMRLRGRILEGLPWASRVVVTIHPSAVLRNSDGSVYFDMLVSDLRLATDAPSSVR